MLLMAPRLFAGQRCRATRNLLIKRQDYRIFFVELIAMDRLLNIGFIKIGYWELQEGQLHYVMTETIEMAQ
ncbi:hypothetical protein C3Z09_03755 [Lelliottia aquatilis]|nr:hypothetical protein C3Z09_03755 [Lelliottia aquatilis]